jgi:hypothetical protein
MTITPPVGVFDVLADAPPRRRCERQLDRGTDLGALLVLFALPDLLDDEGGAASETTAPFDVPRRSSARHIATRIPV